MLEVRNVSCGYKDEDVIKNITFKVKKGEKVCIIGPNGCGKSTLLKSIAGILDYSGEILLDGANLKTMKRREVASKLAYMGQSNKTYFDYTVYETVMLGRYAKGNNSILKRESDEDRGIVESSLEAINIFDLKDRRITELSGGELQRVFLAKTFAQDPDLIMLDEPTNHLDLKYQIELMEYLKDWIKKGERSVVAVLHDINLAVDFADKILLLSDGRQVAYENTDIVLKGNICTQVYEIDVKKYMQRAYAQWNV